MIDELSKEVKLNFNMGFYRFDAIISAAKEFTDNFWITIDGNKKDVIKVILKPKEEFINDVDLNQLGCEFYNFTLASMQNPSLS